MPSAAENPEAGAAALVTQWAARSTLDAADVFVVGPAPFVTAAAKSFSEAGVPAAQLFTETL